MQNDICSGKIRHGPFLVPFLWWFEQLLKINWKISSTGTVHKIMHENFQNNLSIVYYDCQVQLIRKKHLVYYTVEFLPYYIQAKSEEYN